jgi:hypothetical protein
MNPIINHTSTTTSSAGPRMDRRDARTSLSLSRVCTLCQLLGGLADWWPLANPAENLSALAFAPAFLPMLWSTLSRAFLDPFSPWCVLGRDEKVKDGITESRDLSHASLPALDPRLVLLDPGTSEAFGGMLSLFCVSFAHLLVVLSDHEFHTLHRPFDFDQLTRMVWLCKQLVALVYSDNSSTGTTTTTTIRDSAAARDRLGQPVIRLFRQLRERHSRKAFCAKEAWLLPHVATEGALLAEVPFVIPFERRVELLYRLIEDDKQRWENGDFGQAISFAQHGLGGAHVSIRRNRLLVDGFDKLNGLGPLLKGRVRISFIDEHGLPEAGVDGGGLFKEFLTALIKVAFDPGYGIFRETADHYVYPNPEAELLPEFEEHLQYFGFMGRVIGKALYDGIQIEPRFTHFFLRATLGQYNSVDDLQTLDPELYKNVMYLKTFEGDFDSLGLSFSVTRAALGQAKDVDLIPNGSLTPVTRDNLSRFIYTLADYKLNKEISRQSSAFFAGMRQVVDLQWLSMFAADELGDMLFNISYISAFFEYFLFLKGTLLSGAEMMDMKVLNVGMYVRVYVCVCARIVCTYVCVHESEGPAQQHELFGRLFRRARTHSLVLGAAGVLATFGLCSVSPGILYSTVFTYVTMYLLVYYFIIYCSLLRRVLVRRCWGSGRLAPSFASSTWVICRKPCLPVRLALISCDCRATRAESYCVRNCCMLSDLALDLVCRNQYHDH